MTKEEKKEYDRAYYQAHKQERKQEQKAYYEAHREERINHQKAYNQAHRAEHNKWKKNYNKGDVNSLGQTKQSIRFKSYYYLTKNGSKIPGYEIHHCFTYDEPFKFIYCSKEMHRLIHSYLREHNIDADSEHYEQIKHLLDDTVILYGITK